MMCLDSAQYPDFSNIEISKTLSYKMRCQLINICSGMGFVTHFSNGYILLVASCSNAVMNLFGSESVPSDKSTCIAKMYLGLSGCACLL